MATTYDPTHRSLYQAGYQWPAELHNTSAATTNRLIDADGEKVAIVFPIRRTGTIDAVVYGLTACSASCEIKVSLQDTATSGGVDGAPDETEDQFRVDTRSAAGVYESGLLTDDGTDTGNKRSVTEGDIVAAVFEINNFEAGDNFRYHYYNSPMISPSAWLIEKIAGTWGYILTSYGNLMLKYDDGEYVPICPQIGCSQIGFGGLNTFNSGTTPDEIGVQFTIPFDCQVTGVRVIGQFPFNCSLVLYNSANTVVDSNEILFESEYANRGTTTNSYDLPFSAPQDLTADSLYKVTFLPSNASGNTRMALNSSTYGTDSDSPTGQFTHIERTNGGSFSTGTDKFCLILMLSSFAEPAASGGGTRGIMPIPYYRF